MGGGPGLDDVCMQGFDGIVPPRYFSKVVEVKTGKRLSVPGSGAEGASSSSSSSVVASSSPALASSSS